VSNLSENIQGWVSAVLTLTMECVLMPAQPFQTTFPSAARLQCWERKDIERRKMLVIVFLSSVKSNKGAVKLYSWQILRHHNRYIVKYKREGPKDAGRVDSCRSCGKTYWSVLMYDI
jgi:hypothetical protein